MPTFDNQSEYNKHQTDCENNDCGCSSNSEECGCCPPGLVSVTDDCGNHVGCLTPNDASAYEVTKHIPPTGYVKAFDPVTGHYLGDLTPADWIEYQAALDDTITPIEEEQLFNSTTTDAVAMSVAGQGLTSEVNFNYSVDRFDCSEAILVSMVTPPSGFTFLSGLTSFVIGVEDSIVAEGIQITDVVTAGTYALTIVYSACSRNVTTTLTITVS